MNYYERHLGDYARDTGHLSLLEHGVYTLLMDRYYATEEGIPADQVYRLARARSDDERAAVDAVLSEFFTLDDGIWRSERCEKEIARYSEKRAKAAASANARWADKPKECERNANALQTHCEGNAHQSPVTSNQSKAKTKGDKSPMDLPDWLPPDVWHDWHNFRNARKGWTLKARELSMQTLGKLWSEGFSPRDVVNQSIERGWTGLFPIRENTRGSPTQTQSKTLTALETLQGLKNGNLDSSRDFGRPEQAALPEPRTYTGC